MSGEDPGFFLGGGAPVVLENRRSSRGGRGVRTPCTLSLDPRLNVAGTLRIGTVERFGGNNRTKILYSVNKELN